MTIPQQDYAYEFPEVKLYKNPATFITTVGRPK